MEQSLNQKQRCDKDKEQNYKKTKRKQKGTIATLQALSHVTHWEPLFVFVEDYCSNELSDMSFHKESHILRVKSLQDYSFKLYLCFSLKNRKKIQKEDK